MVGMKALALGKLAHIYDRALQFAFSQPLDTIVVGETSLAHLKKNLAIANSFKPMTDTEKLELFREVLPMVVPGNVPWKAEEWGNSAKWLSR